MNSGAGITKGWTDVLRLRNEVRATDGSVGELQMSLAKAVYQTVPVPYADCDYYTDITEPTPKLVGFFGRVARRLGTRGFETQACFHLDQGMGGGKSHALVGVWHMVKHPDQFFNSELGQQVLIAAGVGGHRVDLSDVVLVVLTCDGFSPGKTDPRFGPATDLFGRFLWTIFQGHPEQMGRWQHYHALGPNKTTLQAIFAEVARPVLILIDELMDYVMALTDQTSIGGLPGEQAFLNALTDSVDDQPNVILVLVMIRSDEDESGYHPAAEAFRDYLTPRLQRNGETVTVTEPADFANIIRRRLFEVTEVSEAATAVATKFVDETDRVWLDQVYAKLGAGRGIANLQSRIPVTYPFHPDLFALVSKEWTVVQAFQRVRSTVSIFARTALYWVDQQAAGQWVPSLIGVGDIPLQTDALEALLSSGVLAGNDRAIQGYRAVANTDVIHTGGGGGTANELDAALARQGVSAGQPNPAVRMATACFTLSLVPRPRGSRGATRAELLAAIHEPGVAYSSAEEVFNALVAGPLDGGLGALEYTAGGTNNTGRFYLSIKQTLTMYHANASAMVDGDKALSELWSRTQELATKGPFPHMVLLNGSQEPVTPISSLFGPVDSQENRLVVLDPRRWTVLNGRDATTRADLESAFGIAPGVNPTFAASMIVAVATTQRRDRAKSFAKDLLAWKQVVVQLSRDDEEYPEAVSRRDEASRKLDDSIRKAYQHYAYLLRTSSGLAIQYKTVPDERTTLSGANVWAALVSDGRAVAPGQLAADYVDQLLVSGSFGRDLTPKELFSQPYSNPSWPLIASDTEMRWVLYTLAISDKWMLTDSDGIEVRLSSPDQIQPATLQQTLRPRPVPADRDARGAVGTSTVTRDSAHGSNSRIPEWDKNTDGVSGDQHLSGTAGNGAQGTTYEITTLTLPDTSVTDPAKREQLWSLVRELASLLDPANAQRNDLQMIGFTLKVNSREGDTQKLLSKGKSLPALRTKTEQDEM